MTIDTKTLKELREKADKATPGPWRVLQKADYQLWEIENSSGEYAGTWGDNLAEYGEPENPRNANFVLAFSPSVCLELLDEIDRLRDDNTRLREALGEPPK